MQPPSPQPAGAADVFDQVVLVADGRLRTDPVDDLFRASLIAGAACARSMVTRVPHLREAWEDGAQVDAPIGAALLAEFWGAVIASRLLGRVEDRDDVLLAISDRFANDLFGSSISGLAWSLQTFESQLALGLEVDPSDGSQTAGPMLWRFLYWRSRDLLAGDLLLQNRYHPAADLEAWQTDPRHASLTPPADEEGPTLAREILLWGIESASTHFAALRAEAESEAESEGVTPSAD